MTLNTASEIAKELGIQQYTVDYAIKTLGIKPTQRIGIIRVFSKTDVAKIKTKLARRHAG